MNRSVLGVVATVAIGCGSSDHFELRLEIASAVRVEVTTDAPNIEVDHVGPAVIIRQHHLDYQAALEAAPLVLTFTSDDGLVVQDSTQAGVCRVTCADQPNCPAIYDIELEWLRYPGFDLDFDLDNHRYIECSGDGRTLVAIEG